MHDFAALRHRFSQRTAGALLVLSVLGALAGSAGCGSSNKKQAQALVQSGSDTSESLASYYDSLVTQNESFVSLRRWRDAKDGSGTALYRIRAVQFVDGGKLLANRLKTGQDPITEYLKARLSSGTKTALDHYDGTIPLPVPLQTSLRDDLNVVLQDPGFANQERRDYVLGDLKATQTRYEGVQKRIHDLEHERLTAKDPVQRGRLTAAIALATRDADALGPHALRDTVVIRLIASASPPASGPDPADPDETPPPSAASPAADPAVMRLNRLVLGNAFQSEIDQSLLETFAIQNELLGERAGLARSLKALYDSLGRLIDYDAPGQAKAAASGLQKEIETVNHHPFTVGGATPLIPKSVFGDLAAQLAQAQQEADVRKDAPLIKRVLVACHALFDAERPDYAIVSTRYYEEAEAEAHDMLRDKEVASLSFLQPAIDPYTLQVLQQPTDNANKIRALTEMIDDKVDAQKRAAQATASRLSAQMAQLENAHDALSGKTQASGAAI